MISRKAQFLKLKLLTDSSIFPGSAAGRRKERPFPRRVGQRRRLEDPARQRRPAPDGRQTHRPGTRPFLSAFLLCLSAALCETLGYDGGESRRESRSSAKNWHIEKGRIPFRASGKRTNRTRRGAKKRRFLRKIREFWEIQTNPPRGQPPLVHQGDRPRWTTTPIEGISYVRYETRKPFCRVPGK